MSNGIEVNEGCTAIPVCELRMRGIEDALDRSTSKMDELCTLLRGGRDEDLGLVGRVHVLEMKTSAAEKAGAGLMKMVAQWTVTLVLGAIAGYYGHQRGGSD